MIVGFNHNVMYRGVVFHVQTEDSGISKPHIITLLYHAGTIISSKKKVYSDLLDSDSLEQLVTEMAKEQHKQMLRDLTRGLFNERIADFGIALEGGDADSAPVDAKTSAANEAKIDALLEEMVAAMSSGEKQSNAMFDAAASEMDGRHGVDAMFETAAAEMGGGAKIDALFDEMVSGMEGGTDASAMFDAVMGAMTGKPQAPVDDVLDDLIFNYLNAGRSA